jgi:hypothetical protein
MGSNVETAVEKLRRIGSFLVVQAQHANDELVSKLRRCETWQTPESYPGLQYEHGRTDFNEITGIRTITVGRERSSQTLGWLGNMV